jgi:hypothetical protein
MLTPKGEHSIPCSTRAMFDGRISFDGIATVKNFVVGYYFRAPPQVKKKRQAKIPILNHTFHATCKFHRFSTGFPKVRKTGVLGLSISI